MAGSMALETQSLSFSALQRAYRDGALGPHDVVDEVNARIDRDRERVRHVWLARPGAEAMHAAAARAIERSRAGESLPLFGIPFAVKDNIDVAGMPTTAACPAFAYTPSASALVVQRLVDAGAIVAGKVNLDQLATGLVGVRSPYGVPTNPFDARMIPGGSSSGSAVAVAAGQVSFALGTDTAGSGRVPAGFNNIVGLKPSRGALSTRGVVPACRSLDCVSVFALSVADVCAVANAARQWDARDGFSRLDAQGFDFAPVPARRWRIGVPPASQLSFFGDEEARSAFDRALARLEKLGVDWVEVDLRPLREAGDMLYGAACVAERLVVGQALLDRVDPGGDTLLPVIRDILSGAGAYTALDAYRATYRLREIRQSLLPTWQALDALVLPTAPTIYSVEEVLAHPREYNSNIGIYSTFANLLDLAAVSVPNGFRADGLPTGVTFFGPHASDPTLIAVADAFHHAVGGTVGATGIPLESAIEAPAMAASSTFGDRVRLVVVGAHLTGQPLNHQLVGLGGKLESATVTAPRYRLYALAGTVPPKPGLERVPEHEQGRGRAIEVEVWSLTVRAFGAFVRQVPRPMCIGSIELSRGELVHGFLCEREAIESAVDISEHGGWRAFLRATAAAARA
jgi:allophanate hydrolase